MFVDDDVFDDGAETNGIEDQRFFFARQIDALGVATAFQIEYGTDAPTVFVVANQQPVGICRERRLARAGEAEKERHVSIGASVRRTVHRQHVAHWQEKVLNAKQRLFHLAGVA